LYFVLFLEFARRYVSPPSFDTVVSTWNRILSVSVSTSDEHITCVTEQYFDCLYQLNITEYDLKSQNERDKQTSKDQTQKIQLKATVNKCILFYKMCTNSCEK
jgi:hypothetical protein